MRPFVFWVWALDGGCEVYCLLVLRSSLTMKGGFWLLAVLFGHFLRSAYDVWP